MNHEKIELVVCLDDRFVIGFVAMLESLMDHKCGVYTLHLYLVHRDVSAENVERITRYLSAKFLNFEWVHIDVTSISGLVTLGHLRLETYFRLLIPRLLSQSVNKVLYLDCDLIVTDDIEKLWEVNLEHKKIGICKDWNAGVLIMNLEEWRKENFGERLIEYVRDYPEKCPLADNSAIIELTESDDAVVFDNRWNMSHSSPVFFRGIVHFVGAVKPWHYEYPRNWSSELFFKYVDNTEWRGWRPSKPNCVRTIRGLLVASNTVIKVRRAFGRHRWGVKVINFLKNALP